MTVYLWANQPVVEWEGNCYVRFRNFLDFFVELANLEAAYELTVPYKVLDRPPDNRFVAITLPKNLIKLAHYEGHVKALYRNFISAVRLGMRIRIQLKHSPVVVAGAGPNSGIFWLSLIAPKSVRFAIFIRGDTLATVRLEYCGNAMYPLATGIVRIFRRRINNLARRKRARVFVYGEMLKAQYPGDDTRVVMPLIGDSILRADGRAEIGDGDLKVLCVGRLSEEKNLLSMIEACAVAARAGTAYKLTIVGHGPQQKIMAKMVSDLNLTEQVNLVGYIPYGPALIEQYDANDLLCLPSRTESIGRVVIEAFARGMPVMATRVGSLPNLFPNEIRFLNGFDANAIVAGLHWCQNHRSELSQMGHAGHKMIRRFLIRDNAAEVRDILNDYVASAS